jgi:hypothetical protein
VEDGSQAVWGGWLAAMVRILYFGFDSKGEPTGRSICKKMKWRQRACLGSVERKRDTVNLARLKIEENLCG